MRADHGPACRLRYVNQCSVQKGSLEGCWYREGTRVGTLQIRWNDADIDAMASVSGEIEGAALIGQRIAPCSDDPQALHFELTALLIYLSTPAFSLGAPHGANQKNEYFDE
jgi:hypothetical protein